MLTDTLLEIVLASLDEGKGLDIKSIDVKDKTSVTDFMLVVTGRSQRHVKSLGDHVVDDVKKNGFRPLGVEGEQAGEWVLIDFGDVIIHVMTAQTREFYQLEKLWEFDLPKASNSNQ